MRIGGLVGLCVTLVAACTTVASAADKVEKPVGEPKSVLVECGDVTVRFDARKFWTMNRVDYKGDRLCRDAKGSHYGTVISIKGIGYVGTGHRENEDERMLQLEFWKDGEKLPQLEGPQAFKAGVFRVVRHSFIKDFETFNDIIVRDNVIDEKVRILCHKPTKIGWIYNYMHPWTVDFKEYLAPPDAGQQAERTGVFGLVAERNHWTVLHGASWVALYNPVHKKGIVSMLLQKPEKETSSLELRDVKKVYRKFYLRCLRGRTVPAGFDGSWRMVTGFFEAEQEKWHSHARNRADELMKLAARKADGQ